MDNWHLINYAFEDKNRVRYIISAFAIHEEGKENDDVIQNIQEEIKEMK